MKIATVFSILCFGATITSAAIYGKEVDDYDSWWDANFYVKFNSPSGKKFYIDFYDGTICNYDFSLVFTKIKSRNESRWCKGATVSDT